MNIEKFNNKIVSLFIGVLLVLGLLLVACNPVKQTPSEKFFQLIKAGETEKALEMARSIKDDDLLFHLGIWLAIDNKHDLALTMAELISRSDLKDAIREKIGDNLLKAKKVEQALEIYELISDMGRRERTKYSAYFLLAYSAALAGEIEKAIKYIEAMPGEKSRHIRMAVRIINALIRYDDREKALPPLDKALQLLDRVKEWSAQIWSLDNDIVHMFIHKKAADQLIAVTKTIENQEIQDQAFKSIAIKLDWFNDTDRGVEIAKLIENEEVQSWAFYKMVRNMSWNRRNEQALEVADLIKNKPLRTLAKGYIAYQLASHDAPKQALAIAKTADTKDEQIWIVGNVVKALAERGDITRIKKLVDAEQDMELLDLVLCCLCYKLSEGRDNDEEVEKIAGMIKNPEIRSLAMHEIVSRRIERSDEQALKILRKSKGQ